MKILKSKLLLCLTLVMGLTVQPAMGQTMADQFGESARFFYFMIAGFPGVTQTSTALVENSATFYRAQAGNCAVSTALDDCDGPPPAGMLSLYNQIILGYGDASFTGIAGLLRSVGDIDECSEIPATLTTIDVSSGLPAGETLVLKGGPGTTVIPTGHNGANGVATFEKRLEVTYADASEEMRFIVELNCPSAAQIAAGEIQLYFGMNFGATGTTPRIIDFYADKTTGTAQKFEFFMNYTDGSGQNQSQYLAQKMNINGTTKDFDYILLMVNQDAATQFNGHRFQVDGNATADDFSIAYQQVTTKTSFANVVGGDAGALTGVGGTFAGGGPLADGDIVVICLTGDGSGTYTGPADVDIANNAECAAYPLTADTTAPAVQAGKTWSINWAADEAGGLGSSMWNGVIP